MAFLLTFCISVIPLTIVELFPDVFPGVVNTAGFIALIGAALISVSLPLFIHSEIKNKFSRINVIVFTSLTAVTIPLLLYGIIVQNDSNIEIIHIIIYIILSLSVLLSVLIMIFLRVSSPNIFERRIERATTIGTLIAIPLFLCIDFFGYKIEFIRNLFTPGFYTLPVFYTYLNIMLALLHISRISNFGVSIEIDDTILVKMKISPREKDVLQLLIKGKTYAEIGAILFISIPTVKSHTNRIYHKSGAKNRVSLLHKVRKRT